MARRLLVALATGALVCLGPPAWAQQSRAETLADIRQELSVLFVEIQRLRGELNTTGAPMGGTTGGSVLSRVDAIEAELRRLTGLTEALQLRIDRVVSDGTNRIGDLEFRLCELEADCDIADLGETPRLGGAEAGATAPAAQTPDTGAGAGAGAGGPRAGANLAVAEQSDFDRAMAAFEAGDYAGAAELFGAFTQTYPGGPLSAEAHFLRGASEAQTGGWSRAARAYLDAFTADPQGARAPAALLNLGRSLGQLGQVEEACLTLGEVAVRYPGDPAVAEAEAAREQLNCS
jgi:tol-pal system protein YbgF